jgi:hypothetical protein
MKTRSYFLVLARRGCLLATVAAAPLVGCAIQYTPLVSDLAVMPGYAVADVRNLAGRTVRVEVYGNPFGLPAHAFSGQVAANMNQSASASARFAAQPSSGDATPYRVVWDFAPPQEGSTPNAICQAKSVESSRAGTPIDAYAAFCRGSEALSSVRGRLYYTDTQNSLEFLNLIGVMTAQLFPADPPGFRRSGDTRLGRRSSTPF